MTIILFSTIAAQLQNYIFYLVNNFGYVFLPAINKSLSVTLIKGYSESNVLYFTKPSHKTWVDIGVKVVVAVTCVEVEVSIFLMRTTFRSSLMVAIIIY